MAFDGIFLSSVCRELSVLEGAKVEKINQPERDEVVFTLHAPKKEGEKHVKLVISVNPSRPMIYLTAENRENPLVAPNFCMLLRKHLSSSRIISVSQEGLDRIVTFEFESKTEMYETVRRKLIVEIMGRFSNLIFTDGDGIIYDAVKQVDFSLSASRQILPQLKYEYPEKQDRADIRFSPEFSYGFSSEERADKVLNFYFTGFSPLISREIVFCATGVTDKRLCDFAPEEKLKLQEKINEFSERIKNGNFDFTSINTDKPVEFHCLPITQYGNFAEKKTFGSPSETVESFYSERVKTEHIKRHSADLLKAVTTAVGRTQRKLAAREAELENCKKAEEYRRYGDLLFASPNKSAAGEKFIRVPDYMSDGREITVPLEPSLSVVKNAQRYYKLYKKARNAEEMLKKEIPSAKEELLYLGSVLSSLQTAENLPDLKEIREELIREGYIKNTAKNSRTKPKSGSVAAMPLLFYTSENIPVYVGKNNTQNDWLTTKFANKQDMWFHVKNYPGSHVILASANQPFGDISVTEAATLAATFSSVSEGGKTEVDYLPVKGVKKPSGAKPGMVVYEGYKTAVVSPDKSLADKLSADKKR